MARGNNPAVFIFKWRVFDFSLIVSKEKGSVKRHPDNSRLESARFRSSLLAGQVRGCLEPAREQHYYLSTCVKSSVVEVGVMALDLSSEDSEG